MRECRILWDRYETAIMRCRRALTPDAAAAWWSEAQEWLRRYFNAVEYELERQLQRPR